MRSVLRTVLIGSLLAFLIPFSWRVGNVCGVVVQQKIARTSTGFDLVREAESLVPEIAQKARELE